MRAYNRLARWFKWPTIEMPEDPWQVLARQVEALHQQAAEAEVRQIDLQQALEAARHETAKLHHEIAKLHREPDTLREEIEVMRQSVVREFRREMAEGRQRAWPIPGRRKPHVCFVALYCYPLFNPDTHSPFGGSEVRVALLAKELAKRGRFDVSLVVFDHGQPEIEQREGVTLYAWPGLRAPAIALPEDGEASENAIQREKSVSSATAPPQAAPDNGRAGDQVVGRIGSYVITQSDVAIYDRIGADIYVMPGASFMSAKLAFYCEQHDKPYVFLAGSDHDYHPNYLREPLAESPRGRGFLMAYAAQKARLHILQNESQAKWLRPAYPQASIVIRNPVDLADRLADHRQNDTLLWVGKANKNKRPEIILDLARRLPEHHFVIIMTLADPDIFRQSAQEAQVLPNVTFLPYVPYREVEAFYAAAKVLVNTSVYEGFPNTFLQAAKYGVPIVSYQTDPGEMLSQHGCGLLCDGDLAQLVENTRRLMTDPRLHAEIGARCLAYVRTYHDKTRIVAQYEQALETLLASE